jgi:hypothetical protein
MPRNNTYLIVNATIVMSTVLALVILMASSGYIISNAAVGIVYWLCAGIGLLSLLLSLLLGFYGVAKSLSLLGCAQWNVRMVRSGFIVQIILLCVGLVVYLASLLFIR